MFAPFADVCCASMPPAGLASLAEVRAVPGIAVLRQQTLTWVQFEAGDEHVLRRILPVAGVTLYAFRDGHWYRFGEHLPAFDVVTEGEFQPLYQVLFPAPVQPVAPRAGSWSKVLLTLHPDNQPRTTTAMICQVSELLAWADSVPSCRLATLQAARNGDRVLVMGSRLPLLGEGDRHHFLACQPDASARGRAAPLAYAAGLCPQRLWGETVLQPLGYCLAPSLPEPAVRECLKLGDDELAIITEHGIDVLCRSDLRPLDRASLRLAQQEAAR